MGDRRVFNTYLFEDIVFERYSGFAWWPHDCVNKRSTVVRAYSWVVTQPEYTAGVYKSPLRPEDNASSSYHPSARLTHFFLKANITIPTSVEKRLWMFWWDTPRHIPSSPASRTASRSLKHGEQVISASYNRVVSLWVMHESYLMGIGAGDAELDERYLCIVWTLWIVLKIFPSRKLSHTSPTAIPAISFTFGIIHVHSHPVPSSIPWTNGVVKKICLFVPSLNRLEKGLVGLTQRYVLPFLSHPILSSP